MNYRTPLQHLMRKLSPHSGPADRPAPADDFADTRPDFGRPPAALRRQAATATRPSGTWNESALDLAQGTEIMEFPDETAADLMDEFFVKQDRRAG